MESKDVISVLERLRRGNELSVYEDEQEEVEIDSIALETAIEVMRHKESINFTKETLNIIMDEIVEEFFSDETIRYGYGLMDVIEAVEAKYSDEIETLEIA